MTTDKQCPSCGGFCKKSGCERENVREWQGLTDEEIESTVDEIAIDAEDKVLYPMGSFARAIEAKLKEKNEMR